MEGLKKAAIAVWTAVGVVIIVALILFMVKQFKTPDVTNTEAETVTVEEKTPEQKEADIVNTDEEEAANETEQKATKDTKEVTKSETNPESKPEAKIETTTQPGATQGTVKVEEPPITYSTATGPITAEEYSTFKKTCNDYVDNNKMQDIHALMTKDYTGTWYDPVFGEAIRLTSEGAYVYIPYLDLYGDELCKWEVIDRSARGLCPMLEIHCFGDNPGLAYYIAGYDGKYFYGKSQGYVFYKQ